MYSNLELVQKNENENSLAQKVNNKHKKEEEQVEIIEYEESVQGLISSMVERYPITEELYDQVVNEWK